MSEVSIDLLGDLNSLNMFKDTRKSLWLALPLIYFILYTVKMNPRVVSVRYSYSDSDFSDHKPLGVCSDKPNKPTHVYTCLQIKLYVFMCKHV